MVEEDGRGKEKSILLKGIHPLFLGVEGGSTTLLAAPSISMPGAGASLAIAPFAAPRTRCEHGASSAPPPDSIRLASMPSPLRAPPERGRDSSHRLPRTNLLNTVRPTRDRTSLRCLRSNTAGATAAGIDPTAI